MTIAVAKEAGVLRWSVSLALALTLHVLALGLFLAEGRAGESADSPPAIVLDLIVLPVEPEVAPDEALAAAPDSPLPPAAPEASDRESTEPPQACDPQASRSSASGSAGATTLTEWKSLLRHHLDRHKQYPADAERRGQQGAPHVFFTVCHDGRVLAARILRTSGVASLDQAGVDLVRRAAPLPAFPQGLPGEMFNLVVPVEFFLVSARH